MADSLRERPAPWAAPDKDKSRTDKAARVPAAPYNELASLVRYEHVDASLAGTPGEEQLGAAMAQLEADDRKREHLDFTLKDITGKAWTFSELRGKVVLVNFWATWCPPCRKEMPDLEALYERFSAKGLVVLGISDEKGAKVEPFIRERKVSFPVLLDPGRKVNEMFVVEGIPKSFVYDRGGKAGSAVDRYADAEAVSGDVEEGRIGVGAGLAPSWLALFRALLTETRQAASLQESEKGLTK